jgi:hypothetical protein
MGDTLKNLGDDWHNPHPYEKLILSVSPSLSYSQIDQIERCLLSVYEAEHYDFKIYRDKAKYTLYDAEVAKYEGAKKKCEEDLRREQDSLKEMYKRLEELVQEQRKNGFIQEGYVDQQGDEFDGEGSEEDDDEYEMKRSKKQVKEANVRKKQLKDKLASAVKAMYSSIGTGQQKCMEYSNEADTLETKKNQMERLRTASMYYQDGMRAAVLQYEKTRDLVSLVKNIQEMLTKYNQLLR